MEEIQFEMPAEREWKPPLPIDEAQALLADPRAAPERRLLACEQFIQRGATADAEPALREMERLPQTATAARRLLAVARYVERAMAWLDFRGARPAAGRWQTLDGRAPGESSDPTGALLWVREDTRKTVLVFSTYSGGFGPMRGWGSVFLAHRFLSGLPLNVVYLRDETYCLNLAGNRSLGADYAGCLEGLRALHRSHRWSGLYAIGLSMGGYSALRFALDLGARAALSFSGPTTLASATYRKKLALEGFYSAAPQMAVDLLPLYRAAARRPRLLLCYGDQNPLDVSMARRMTEFGETELVPLQGFSGHSTFMEAGRRGDLRSLTVRLAELEQ